MRAGGGTNHRGGLDDGILIKDNHIRLAGGVARGGAADEGGAARRCRSRSKRRASSRSTRRSPPAPTSSCSTTCRSTTIREAVRRIAGRAKIEISGGVTLDRIPELAATGADYVSVGALTHSAPAADLSFELEPDSPDELGRRARGRSADVRAADSPDDLARCARSATAAPARRVRQSLYFFAETGSTNDVAAALAERGAPEGTTVVAVAQTAGRGRFGRDVVFAAWRGPLRLGRSCRSAAAAPLLTLAGGVAVADGIRAATGLPVADQVAERHRRRRRRAGAAAQARRHPGRGLDRAGRLQHVILGFGINLRSGGVSAGAGGSRDVDRNRARAARRRRGRCWPRRWRRSTDAFAQLARGRSPPRARRAGARSRRRRAAPPSSGTRQTASSSGHRGRDCRRRRAARARADRVERIISGEVRWM